MRVFQNERPARGSYIVARDQKFTYRKKDGPNTFSKIARVIKALLVPYTCSILISIVEISVPILSNHLTKEKKERRKIL